MAKLRSTYAIVSLRRLCLAFAVLTFFCWLALYTAEEDAFENNIVEPLAQQSDQRPTQLFSFSRRTLMTAAPDAREPQRPTRPAAHDGSEHAFQPHRPFVTWLEAREFPFHGLFGQHAIFDGDVLTKATFFVLPDVRSYGLTRVASIVSPLPGALRAIEVITAAIPASVQIFLSLDDSDDVLFTAIGHTHAPFNSFALHRQLFVVPQNASIVSQLQQGSPLNISYHNPVVVSLISEAFRVSLHELRFYVDICDGDGRSSLVVLRSTWRHQSVWIPTPNDVETPSCVFPSGYGLLESEFHSPSLDPVKTFYSAHTPTPAAMSNQFRDASKSYLLPIALSDAYDCVIYTALFGQYETQLKRVVPQDRECHRVVFTDALELFSNDTQRRRGNWSVITEPLHLAADTRLQSEVQSKDRVGNSVSSLMHAKFYKMKPFLIFPAHIRFAIWIDGTREIINSGFSTAMIDSMVRTGSSFAARTHTLDVNSEMMACQLHFESRYNTFTVVLQQYLAHLSLGFCSHFFLAGEKQNDDVHTCNGTTTGLQVAQFIDEVTLAGVLHYSYCRNPAPRVRSKLFSMQHRGEPNTKLEATLAARRFLLRYHTCRPRPPDNSLLPSLLPEVTLPHAINKTFQSAMYDCSILAFDLHQASDDPSRSTFLHMFLSQWFEDTRLHGKDQVTLMQLLWRTPTYFPVAADVYNPELNGMVRSHHHGR